LEFFVYLLLFKSYLSALIWQETWHSGAKIWDFGGFDPKYNFISKRDPQKAFFQQTASFELSCLQIGCAVWSAEA
jgi:hypothetical protein